MFKAQNEFMSFNKHGENYTDEQTRISFLDDDHNHPQIKTQLEINTLWNHFKDESLIDP